MIHAYIRQPAEGSYRSPSLSRPHKLRERKVTPELEQLILRLRTERNIGPKRILAELLRAGQPRLSTATLWKVLRRNQVPPLRKPLKIKSPKRYTRPIPGDRVQVDTMKVASGLYPFTAIDDCTRMRVLGLYPRRTAAHAVHFLKERMLEEFPFPIQRIQTDRGQEFFAYDFQDALHEQHIKFRPTRPRSPHLNGKVERSQQTDLFEFWACMELGDDAAARRPEREQALGEWQHFYNWQRPHGGLGGRTPYQRAHALWNQTPETHEVWEQYDEKREYQFGGRVQEYELDQRLQKLRNIEQRGL